MQGVVRAAAEPLKGFKEHVRDTYGFFADADNLATTRRLLDGVAAPVYVGFVALIAMATGVSLLSLFLSLSLYIYIYIYIYIQRERERGRERYRSGFVAG